MISRDLRGRIAGVFLYIAFLAFHIVYVRRDWGYYNTAAKVNSLLITATIVFFLSSYFLRRKPVLFPKGFKETLFPLFCAGLPLVIYHSVELLRFVPAQNAATTFFHALVGVHRNKLLGWNFLSMSLVLREWYDPPGNNFVETLVQHYGGSEGAGFYRPLRLCEASAVYRRGPRSIGSPRLPLLAGKSCSVCAFYRMSGIPGCP